MDKTGAGQLNNWVIFKYLNKRIFTASVDRTPKNWKDANENFAVRRQNLNC